LRRPLVAPLRGQQHADHHPRPRASADRADSL